MGSPNATLERAIVDLGVDLDFGSAALSPMGILPEMLDYHRATLARLEEEIDFLDGEEKEAREEYAEGVRQCIAQAEARADGAEPLEPNTAIEVLDTQIVNAIAHTTLCRFSHTLRRGDAVWLFEGDVLTFASSAEHAEEAEEIAGRTLRVFGLDESFLPDMGAILRRVDALLGDILAKARNAA